MFCLQKISSCLAQCKISNLKSSLKIQQNIKIELDPLSKQDNEEQIKTVLKNWIYENKVFSHVI